MIEVTGLSKRYGSHLAVNDVSFKIEDGEVVGFLGPNGAGKSTIMNILTGYLSLTTGTAEIDGFNIVESPEQAKRRIGYLPEIPPLYTDMTVMEYLGFIYELKKVKLPRKPHLAEICSLVKIDNVSNRLIKNLSKGYRQRVGIAQALIGNPDVLILDEPTVGLDPKQIIEIRNLISKLGKNHTVILSSHILSEIQAVCRRVIVINNGSIVADGTPEELSRNMSEDHSLELRVIGNENDTKKLIESVEGVASVESLGSRESGSFDFEVTPVEGTDIRRALFERLASRNRPIISMKTNELSLEQIFLRLTDETKASSLFAVDEVPSEDDDSGVTPTDEAPAEITETEPEKEEAE